MCRCEKCSCQDVGAIHVCLLCDFIQVLSREDFECSAALQQGSYIADARIQRVYKDNTGLGLSKGEVVTISSSLYSNLCGYELAEDTQYIVFARRTGGARDEDGTYYIEDHENEVCSPVSCL